jgi:hypothetical protein
MKRIRGESCQIVPNRAKSCQIVPKKSFFRLLWQKDAAKTAFKDGRGQRQIKVNQTNFNQKKIFTPPRREEPPGCLEIPEFMMKIRLILSCPFAGIRLHCFYG